MNNVLKRLGVENVLEVNPFPREEDDTFYEVWKVTMPEGDCVLKKAKPHELAVYDAFFREDLPGAPRFLGSVEAENENWFLMEYVSGTDLRRCDRDGLTTALDALISLQERFWESPQTDGYSFEESFQSRKNRGSFLNDPLLEQAYSGFLKLYESLPRTLCHDDLLPFNVLVDGDKATIIDWEYAGILPYPTSLVRLIAHSREKEDAFFYMTEADKAFAIDYYYEHLVKSKGISYEDYRRTVDYFLLYEYCEWIMLGNKYPDEEIPRAREYLTKTKDHIRSRSLT